MKSPLLLTLLVLTAPALVRAQTVNLQFSSNSTIDVAPGGTFSVNLELVNDTDPNIIGYDFALESIDSTQTPVSGIFTVTGVTNTSSVLSEQSDPSVGPTSTFLLNPQAGPSNQPTDFGATTPDNAPFSGLGTGTFSLETVTFSVGSAAASGNYQLVVYEPTAGGGLGPVNIVDSDFNDPTTATGPVYSPTINIEADSEVPEPSTWALILGGLSLLAILRGVRSFRAV